MAHSTSDPNTKKCPCCSNPWQAATGDFFAKLCQTCAEGTTTSSFKNNGGLSRENMDFTVQPQENFFLYANGNWMKNNPIPSGYPSWNSFMTLRLKSQEDCKTILSDLEHKLVVGVGTDFNEVGITDEERKVATFYRAAMDTTTIESLGTKPMYPLLNLCDMAAECKDDKAAFARCLGEMARKYGVNPFFSVDAGPDKKDSAHSIAQISQGGIRLPDRDYYFDEDKEEQRVAYKKFMTVLLTLLPEEKDVSTTKTTFASVLPGTEENIDVEEHPDMNHSQLLAIVEKVYELEKILAEAHMTKTENRDPHDTYNKMSIEDVTKNGNGGFDFQSYFEAFTGKTMNEIGEVNLRNVKALQRVAEVAPATDATTLRAYFRWLAVSSCAPYLSSPFVSAHFEFYEKSLQGTQEIKERWKRAMEWTETAVGEALGKLYCGKFFDETSKERALAIVEQVRQALEDRLREVEWMKSEDTRANALRKMDNFGVKIGYPDKWLDYSTLVIGEEEDFLTMIFAAREFANMEEVKNMNAPTDKKKWFMTPQTVNAYYHPSLNEIVFPAAILQHPFFDKDADDAVNFGSMGAVIGHEMTHGFDDKGRKFDYLGNMVDWWTEVDGQEYEKRVHVMVKQADEFEVHGQAVKGKLTSGENIADLGGLRLALRGLMNTKEYNPSTLIDGFTPIQRFFLSWAQCWRQNITRERALQLLTIDPHGPNELRCNGPLSNMAEFHEAFSVGLNDPMYKEMEARVDIW